MLQVENMLNLYLFSDIIREHGKEWVSIVQKIMVDKLNEDYITLEWN